MSHTLETLDGRPNRFGLAGPLAVVPREPAPADLIALCDRLAVEVATESIVFFSAQSERLVYVNRAACEHLGYAQYQLQRMSVREIAPLATKAKLAALCDRIGRSAKQRARIRTVYRHRSGTLLSVDCSIRMLPTLPPKVFVAIGQHHTSRHCRANESHVGEAFRDSLTLLPDRAWLWRQLDLEFEAIRCSDGDLALLFIDIDRFKEINDTHGHLAGDGVLRTVAERLSTSIRPDDAVARYGGDEFVVLLKNVRDLGDIHRIAERISRGFEATGKSCGEKEWRTQVTLSIGVAIRGGEDSSSVDLLERADRAMYRAKALGRVGRYVVDESATSLQSMCFHGYADQMRQPGEFA